MLNIRPPKDLEPRSREAADWHALRAHLAEICGRYAGELGENAYALFNAITDLASHPPASRCLHRDAHALQQLAGSWLTALTAASERPEFSLARQVNEFAQAQRNAERSRPRGRVGAIAEAVG